jgi:CheY-like chemotaxis protein
MQDFVVKKISNPCNVLLAEDDKVNRMVIKRVLKNRGYNVDTAHDGLEAVEKFGEKTYDIILMDIQMPVMDGVEATRRIRKKNANIPIIAITAYALKGDREKFLSLGMNEYVSKPIKYEELYSAMDKCLLLKNHELLDVGVCLDEQGEVVFKQKGSNEIIKRLPFLIEVSYLTEVSDLIEHLKVAVERSELELIEKFAHKAKLIFTEIGIDKLKVLSFKIELATRRGDINEVVENTKQLVDMYARYKNSELIGGTNNENINSGR